MAQAAGKHQPRGREFVKAQQQKIAEKARAKQTHRKLYGRACYQRFRLAFLAEHPLCADCKERRETPERQATEVHHVRKLELHPEDLCDAEHCRALCKKHHDERTGKGE